MKYPIVQLHKENIIRITVEVGPMGTPSFFPLGTITDEFDRPNFHEIDTMLHNLLAERNNYRDILMRDKLRKQ